MQTSLRRFFADESGGSNALEYAAIGAFVSILIAAATRIIGTKLLGGYYMPIADNLT